MKLNLLNLKKTLLSVTLAAALGAGLTTNAFANTGKVTPTTNSVMQSAANDSADDSYEGTVNYNQPVNSFQKGHFGFLLGAGVSTLPTDSTTASSDTDENASFTGGIYATFNMTGTSTPTKSYQHNFIVELKSTFEFVTRSFSNDYVRVEANAGYLGYSVLGGYEFRMDNRSKDSNIGFTTRIGLLAGVGGYSVSHGGVAQYHYGNDSKVESTPVITDESEVGLALAGSIKLGALLGSRFEIGPYAEYELQTKGLSTFSAGIYLGF